MLYVIIEPAPIVVPEVPYLKYLEKAEPFSLDGIRKIVGGFERVIDLSPHTAMVVAEDSEDLKDNAPATYMLVCARIGGIVRGRALVCDRRLLPD